MNITHLRHLLALSECGSFRAAAKRLNLSQSAITKSMKALEAEFGVALILRGSEGSALTDVGRELLSHARSVCREIEVATEKIKRMSGQTRIQLTIGSIVTAAVQVLPSAVRFLQGRHPNLDLSIVSGVTDSLLPRLVEGSLDIAIGFELDGPVPAGVRFQPLATSEYCVIIRRGHPLERAKTLRDLAGAEWIMSSDLARPGSKMAQLHDAHELEQPVVRMQSNCPFFSASMIACTDYLGIARRYMLDEGLLPFSTALAEIPDLRISYRLGVFTRPQHGQALLIEELASNLGEQFTRLGSDRVPLRRRAARS